MSIFILIILNYLTLNLSNNAATPKTSFQHFSKNNQYFRIVNTFYAPPHFLARIYAPD